MESSDTPHKPVSGLDAGASVTVGAYGRRAAKLARLTALGLPVPPGAALSFDCVQALSSGAELPLLPLDMADPGQLFALRSSPESRDWGGPAAVLFIGLEPARCPRCHRGSTRCARLSC